ncbi:fumarate hydratase C-terminal domain-containing protein [bacterium]|nr:fumarate hydratase C-terminal domain-containing protein [bacterium]
MTSPRKIELPLTREIAGDLRAGEYVLLSGTIYTARDAAHKRLVEALEKGEALPFPPEGATIYYTGPTPAPPGAVIGSAGPTTAYRMDPYVEPLLKAGVLGMIGKGARKGDVPELIKKYKAVYFAAPGGCGALLGKSIKECEIIAYPDLGTEAVRRLRVEDFPVFVAQDSFGNSIY